MFVYFLLCFFQGCIISGSNSGILPCIHVDEIDDSNGIRRLNNEWFIHEIDILQNASEYFPISEFNDSEIKELESLSDSLIAEIEPEPSTNETIFYNLYGVFLYNLQSLPIHLKLAHELLKNQKLPRIENISEMIDRRLIDDTICFCQKHHSENGIIDFILKIIEMVINVKPLREKIELSNRENGSLLCILLKNFVLFCIDKNRDSFNFDPVEAFLKTFYVFFLRKVQSYIESKPDVQKTHETISSYIFQALNDTIPLVFSNEAIENPLFAISGSFKRKIPEKDKSQLHSLIAKFSLQPIINLGDLEYDELFDEYNMAGETFKITSFFLQTRKGTFSTIFYRDPISCHYWNDSCGRSISSREDYEKLLKESTGFAVVCFENTRISLWRSAVNLVKFFLGF